MKINDTEFEFDPSDGSHMEKLEKALDIMSEEEKELHKKYEAGKLKHYEFLSGYCLVMKSFFLNSTGADIMKNTTSVDKAIDFYNEFLDQIKVAGERTQQRIKKYDPKKVR